MKRVNKHVKYLIFCILFFAFANYGKGQNDIKLVRQGNHKYADGKYSEAEIDYRKALEINPASFKGSFNLGDALYELKNYEESAKLFQDISQRPADLIAKAKAYHNLGNSMLEAKKYKESIEAYKNALRNNPADMETKYNLAYAQQKLKEQQQQQQPQENKDQPQKKEDDPQDKKEQKQQPQEPEEKNQKQQEPSPKEEQPQQQPNKGQPQTPQPQEISKEEAQRMLEALKNDERKTLEKLMRLKAKKTKGKKIEKDW